MQVNEIRYQQTEVNGSNGRDDVKDNDISDNENVLNKKIKKLLNEIINNAGFTIFEIKQRVFMDKGNGFLGILFEADIIGKTDNGDKDLHIFAKLMTPDKQVGILSLQDVYSRELYTYRELSLVLNGLQEEFNVPLQERYRFAKFYNESNAEAIVMDNLRTKGFKTYHRMEVISLEFAKAALKEIAKFHALSFALQEIRPFYYKNKITSMKHPYTFNDDWKMIVNNLYSVTKSYLTGDAKQKIEDLESRHIAMYKRYLEKDTCVRCLCHGDYRPANIMTSEIDGKIEVIPIDYQLIYYGSPVYDFLYFIFGATDREFRRLHLNNLKGVYYENLRDFLLYFSLDVEDVYPMEEFEQVYKDKLDFGLITSMLLVPIILAADDSVPEMTTDQISNFNVGTTDLCKERIVGLVDDFIDWGYL